MPFSSFWVRRFNRSFLRSRSVFIGFHTSTILSVLPPPSSVFSSISVTADNMNKLGKSDTESAHRGSADAKARAVITPAQKNGSYSMYRGRVPKNEND